jgi:hypothetical protein
VDLSRKLQVKPGQSVAVLNAPPGLVLPGVPAAAAAGDADVLVAFVTRRDDLSAHGVQPVRQVSIDGTWSALRFRPANK